MKFFCATLVTLALAAPASASWWPTISDREVHVLVGETVSVRITPTWSGLVDYGNGVHWIFRTDNFYIAAGWVRLDDSRAQDLRITGIAPGFTSVRQEFPLTGGVSSTPSIAVFVSCAGEPSALPAAAQLRTELDTPVRLTVVSPIANRTTFHWYLGTIGDTSQPLDASGPEMLFTPKTPGSHDVWVSAMTTCSASNVQFHIDAFTAKRRSIRH